MQGPSTSVAPSVWGRAKVAKLTFLIAKHHAPEGGHPVSSARFRGRVPCTLDASTAAMGKEDFDRGRSLWRSRPARPVADWS